MVVVWSGQLERRDAEANRVYPAAAAIAPSVTDAVVAELAKYPGSTMPELAICLGVDQHAVNGAIYALKKRGVVGYADRQVRTEHGRLARGYCLLFLGTGKGC